jgi:ABC-type Mn2+/Zn2+ transport system ATPase subunit
MSGSDSDDDAPKKAGVKKMHSEAPIASSGIPYMEGTAPPSKVPRVLDVKNVTVRFGEKVVVEDVTFHVPVGEFLCLCGPNGAGKSTLLKAILGLVPVTGGTIEIAGLPAREGRKKIGYVPQLKRFDREFPATPVDVIVANLRGRWPLFVKKEERAIAMSVLERTGAAKLADAEMKNLSGGETQRVFLARALATKPDLLILDEPTAGVDVNGRAAIIDLMAEISQSEIIAAILVTHNLHAIARCAERVLYLERKVRAWGLWSELSTNRNLSAIQVASDHRSLEADGD